MRTDQMSLLAILHVLFLIAGNRRFNLGLSTGPTLSIMNQAISSDPILAREMCFLVQSFINRGGDKIAIMEARRLLSFNKSLVPFLIHRLLYQKNVRRRYDGRLLIEIEDLRRLQPMFFTRIAYINFRLYREMSGPFDQTTIAIRFLKQDLRSCKDSCVCNQTARIITDGLSNVIRYARIPRNGMLVCLTAGSDPMMIERDLRNLPSKDFILQLISLIDEHRKLLRLISIPPPNSFWSIFHDYRERFSSK